MENLTQKMRKYISKYENFENEVLRSLKEEIVCSGLNRTRQLLKIKEKYFSLYTLEKLKLKHTEFVRTSEGVKLLREFNIVDETLKDEIKFKHRVFAISTLAKVKAKYQMYKEIYMDTSTTVYIATRFGTFEIGKLYMRDNVVKLDFIHSLVQDYNIDIMPSQSSRFSLDLNENMTCVIENYEKEEFSFDKEHKVHINFNVLSDNYFRSDFPDEVISSVYIDGEKYFDVPSKYIKSIKVNVRCDVNNRHSFSTYISKDDFTSKNLSKYLTYDIQLLGAEFYLSDELSIEGWGAREYDSDVEICYDKYLKYLKEFFTQSEFVTYGTIRRTIEGIIKTENYKHNEYTTTNGFTYYLYDIPILDLLKNKYNVYVHKKSMYKEGLKYVQNIVLFIEEKESEDTILCICIRNVINQVVAMSEYLMPLPIFMIRCNDIRLGNLAYKDNYIDNMSNRKIKSNIQNALEDIKDKEFKRVYSSKRYSIDESFIENMFKAQDFKYNFNFELIPYMPKSCYYNDITDKKTKLDEVILESSCFQTVQHEKSFKSSECVVVTKRYVDKEEAISLDQFDNNNLRFKLVENTSDVDERILKSIKENI